MKPISTDIGMPRTHIGRPNVADAIKTTFGIDGADLKRLLEYGPDTIRMPGRGEIGAKGVSDVFVNTGGPVILISAVTPDGTFPELEAVLLKSGVPFDRSFVRSDANTEMRRFRPAGMVGFGSSTEQSEAVPKVDCVGLETPEGVPVVLAADLAGAVLSEFRSPEKLRKRLAELLAGFLTGQNSPLEDWATGQIVAVCDDLNTNDPKASR